jgi:hypothetical protein
VSRGANAWRSSRRVHAVAGLEQPVGAGDEPVGDAGEALRLRSPTRSVSAMCFASLIAAALPDRMAASYIGAIELAVVAQDDLGLHRQRGEGLGARHQATFSPGRRVSRPRRRIHRNTDDRETTSCSAISSWVRPVAYGRR